MAKPYVVALGIAIAMSPLAASLCLATGQASQSSTSAASGSESLSANDFIDKASAMGTAEINASQMALDKTSSPAVKTFAQHMIQDHTMANKKLAALAQKKGKGDQVSTHSDAKDMALAMKMKMESGATFDKDYASRQVTAHQETIALFEQEAHSNNDPDLKRFAQKTLPTLRQHLQMAQQLAQTTGANTQ